MELREKVYMDWIYILSCLEIDVTCGPDQRGGGGSCI